MGGGAVDGGGSGDAFAAERNHPQAVLRRALRFERKNAGDVQLDAQVRLTVYFRPNNEGVQ